jgi:leucyl-tRNA---protein transferase
MNDQHSLHFYASSPEICGYLGDRESVSAFANPYMDMDLETYNELIQFGFRRSGGYLYRPHCPQCTECVSIRIKVGEYQFSRNDKRTLKNNADLTINPVKGKFQEEHYELYQHYINTRHCGGSMENPTRADYRRFLICDWTDTIFIEFRQDKKLIAVAVTDVTSTGYSAVYTFFEPGMRKRSLGHYAILKQIQLCQEHDLPYLYLGYWIKNCDKMKYKSRYQPAEGFINGHWTDFSNL